MLPMEPGAEREQGSRPPALALAERAEAIGLDSVWVYDHFFTSMPGEPREAIHEAWTIVAAVAACTSRVEIGQLVMCASYRPPGIMAKMAATADAVSGGRVTLGLGAGWHDEEYAAFGYPTDHRVDRFEEAVRIIRPLVRGERVTLAGRYHSVDDAVLLPLDRPIPILIAAKGPRMLRLTARYADAWNTGWYGMPDERVRQRVADLDAALDAEGRERASLRRTVALTVRESQPEKEEDQDPSIMMDELPRAIDAYQKLGVDDLLLGVDPASERSLDRIAQVLGTGA